MELATDNSRYGTRDAERSAEALLFALGSMKKTDLASQLGISPDELDATLASMRERAGERGIIPVDDGTMVALRAAPDAANLIEKARKEEYARDIGRAGLEVLAAILYRGASTRAQIDSIRGVNSSQTLRTLALRGLVRKMPDPRDERQYRYEPTVELLSHLGVAERSELPEYESVRAQLDALLIAPQPTENVPDADDEGDDTEDAPVEQNNSL